MAIHRISYLTGVIFRFILERARLLKRFSSHRRQSDLFFPPMFTYAHSVCVCVHVVARDRHEVSASIPVNFLSTSYIEAGPFIRTQSLLV